MFQFMFFLSVFFIFFLLTGLKRSPMLQLNDANLFAEAPPMLATGH